MSAYTAYPFLVSANVDFDYRTVVTPKELEEPIYADSRFQEGRPLLWRREVVNSKNGDYTSIIIVIARKADNTPYTDGSRDIIRYEGFVIRGSPKNVPIRKAHLDRVHELLTPYFEEFWEFKKKEYISQPPPVMRIPAKIDITDEDAQQDDCLTPYPEHVRDHGYEPRSVKQPVGALEEAHGKVADTRQGSALVEAPASATSNTPTHDASFFGCAWLESLREYGMSVCDHLLGRPKK